MLDLEFIFCYVYTLALKLRSSIKYTSNAKKIINGFKVYKEFKYFLFKGDNTYVRPKYISLLKKIKQFI